MITRICFQGHGISKNQIYETLVIMVTNKFKAKEFIMETGVENKVHTTEIMDDIRNVIEARDWVSIEDRKNVDRYNLFIERVTKNVMSYLTKSNLHIKRYGKNIYHYPKLLNIPRAYFIAKDHAEVDENRRVKQAEIDGRQHSLLERISSAHFALDNKLSDNDILDGTPPTPTTDGAPPPSAGGSIHKKSKKILEEMHKHDK